MLRILTVPNDTAILRTKSAEIKKVDRALVEFLKDLGATLKGLRKPAGVGLSAIQVGKPIRVFATLLPQERVTRAGTPASIRSETSSENVVPGRNEWQDPRSKKIELLFYINPEIIDHSQDLSLGENINPENEGLEPGEKREPFLEGCLSIPKVYGPVKRWTWISARATVLHESELSLPSFDPASPAGGLQPLTLNLRDLSARVFQHELDHLNGILFTDHVLAEGNTLYGITKGALEPLEL